eukprot:scaffold6929_cov99-Cylindrotheca_fusiformis.AAC.1
MHPQQEEEKEPEVSDLAEGGFVTEETHTFAENKEKPGPEDEVAADADEAEAGEGDDEEVVEEGDKKKKVETVSPDAPWSERMWEVFTTFWPLGLVAFGGPQAHVAILRDHLVVQRDWLDEEQFTELFAIGQGLPGPTSTQLVISTALSRAGPLGGLMYVSTSLYYRLVVLTACGVLLAEFIEDPNNPPFWLVGLPPAAISLVFKAAYAFAQKLDSLGVCLSLFSCLIAILINNDDRIRPDASQWVFPTTLAVGGLITFVDHKRANPWSTYSSPSQGWDRDSDETIRRIGIPLWVGGLILCSYGGILILIIVLVDVYEVENVYLEIFETMYRIGSIIFGGGQVVLPMLQDEVVPRWMTDETFLQGLGLAQSMPGPLFNF